ncbi:hypothetical protein F2Q68_00019281 [Brassica cretica]|uniref:Uncharacterized protein n=1 Tax=Brassica cretica TaxID=69181 RepID=A0A8S9G6G7_BRACR|nr:hypothetical protein F2Q68_00019281 [Brassica cretica]
MIPTTTVVRKSSVSAYFDELLTILSVSIRMFSCSVFYSGPQSPNNHIFVMAEYYSEIVFPDPFESFFTYVCYYLAVHISNLPLVAFLLWCLLSSEAIVIA